MLSSLCLGMIIFKVKSCAKVHNHITCYIETSDREETQTQSIGKFLSCNLNKYTRVLYRLLTLVQATSDKMAGHIVASGPRPGQPYAIT